MTGKMITGMLLSLTLLACAAFGCQGACGIQERETAGMVQSRENVGNTRIEKMEAGAGTENEASGENASGDEDSVDTAAEEKNTVEQRASAQIEDFPIINQMPELPTGCEITALTMVLDHYGYPVDKTVMASEYLPTASADRYYGADGRLVYGRRRLCGLEHQ